MKEVQVALLLMLFSVLSLKAQNPFKKTLYNKEYNLTLNMDLYNESIEVPSMEMFGLMNGYLSGNIYRLWIITSAKVESSEQATIRLSNDLGSETQEVKLTVQNDSTYLFEQVDGVAIKRVVKKKLIKIPRLLEFSEIKTD